MAIWTLGGGILGRLESQEDRQAAKDAYFKSVDALLAEGYPPDISRRIAYDKLEAVGMMDPALEEEIELDFAEREQTDIARTGKEASLGGLEILRQAAKGGISPEDRAQLAQIEAEADTAARGREENIMQQMQRQGLSGSGAELAARLQSQQSAAQSQSAAGRDIAAQAAAKALHAAMMSGQLGQALSGQEFQETSADQQARNIANQLKAEFSRARQAANVNRQNLAQQQATEREMLARKYNVEKANEAKEREINQQMAQYKAESDRIGRQAQALRSLGDIYKGEAEETAAFHKGMGQAGDKTAEGAMKMGMGLA